MFDINALEGQRRALTLASTLRKASAWTVGIVQWRWLSRKWSMTK